MNWIQPDWPAPKNIHAAVTSRHGGFSNGAFQSLNLANHVQDDAEKVKKNRTEGLAKLNLPSAPVWLQQEHGIRVVKADQCSSLEQADASYTDQANTVCAVLTADCLPLLLASKDGNKVAAVHAGWRGLLAGVISNTVNSLGTLDLIAWMGPAICADCFEVGEEVKNAFTKKYSKFSEAFKPCNFEDGIKQDKYLANIYQLATIELASIGITQVYGGNFCTITDHERFYSYRRDGEKTGRMATLIWRD
jgi:YfiH family protein